MGADKVVEKVVMLNRDKHKGKKERRKLDRMEENTATPMEIVHMLEAIAALQDLITKTKLLSKI